MDCFPVKKSLVCRLTKERFLRKVSAEQKGKVGVKMLDEISAIDYVENVNII